MKMRIPLFTKSKLATNIALAAATLATAPATLANLELEEIVVTAQKRQESLQDVPVSVAYVSGEQIVRDNLNTFEDLSQSIPNLTVANVANVTAIIVRGIGTGDNRGFEQSVGLFVDGVHQGRDRQTRATKFLDPEAVQVLRGPQGTLFGKNTTGGALIVDSARPSDEFEASYTGTHTLDDGDQNGGYKNEFFVSGPLTESLTGRLALRQIEDYGHYTNTATGDDSPIDRSNAGRLSLDWTPNDDLSVLFQYEIGRSKSKGLPAQLDNYANSAIPGIPLTADQIMAVYGASSNVDGDYQQSVNAEKDNTDTQAATLTVEYDISGHTLTSITGYNEYEYLQARDGDRTAAPLFSQLDDESFRSFSQEFRLTSEEGDTFDYIVGAYFQKTSLSAKSLRNFNLEPLGPVLGIPANYSIYAGLGDATQARAFDSESETAAVFGNLNWHITETVNINFGARFSYETKEAERSSYLSELNTYNAFSSSIPFTTAFDQAVFYGTLAAVNPGLQATAQPAGLSPTETAELAVGLGQLRLYEHSLKDDRSVTDFSPSIRVDWDISEDYLMYAGISRAFKSGGFDEQGSQGDQTGQFNPALGPAQFEFDDEETTSYEIGGKGTFLDGQLNANWAAFYTTVEDRQFSRFIQGQGFIVGNSGQVDFRGIELDTQWLINENWRLDFSAAHLRGVVVEAIESEGTSLEGRGATGDSEWSAHTKLTFETDLTDNLIFSSNLSLDFKDDRYLEASDTALPSELKVDARMAIGDVLGKWEVAIIGQNLTDERLIVASGDNPLLVGALDTYLRPPRTISAQFNYNF